MNRFKKIFTVTASVFVIVCLLTAAIPNSKKEDHKFKNLKVLPKDISEEELDKVMDNFNFSLGVRCSFCHQRNDSTKHLDFPSDAKGEKDIARGMMRMIYDLNKKYFNFNKDKVVPQTINCVTCHRQNAIPVRDTMPERKHG